MNPNNLEKIKHWTSRLGDFDLEEGAVMSPQDAKEFLQANIVYTMYEVEDQDDWGAELIKESAEALGQLAQMQDAVAVKLTYHPMGAIMVTQLKEVER